MTSDRSQTFALRSQEERDVLEGLGNRCQKTSGPPRCYGRENVPAAYLDLMHLKICRFSGCSEIAVRCGSMFLVQRFPLEV
jgi:hypothetical protein